MKALEIRVLGRPAIMLDGRPIDLVSAKAKALLIYLAVSRHAHSRSHLAGLFWGEMTEKRARANLRLALSKIKKAAGPCFRATRQSVAFDGSREYFLDLEGFEGKTSNPVKAGAAEMKRAIDLYRGEFLRDFYVSDSPGFEDWILGERERIRQRMRKTLLYLMEGAGQRQAFEEGINYSRKLISLEPWDENGHHRLMMFLAQSGQRSAALAQYEDYVAVLAEELGIPPSPKVAALAEQIQNNEVQAPDPDLIAGRYALENQIGRGSMGIVYRGRDVESEETVALKMLDPALTADNPEMVTRFRREGEALRLLNHPNIVKLLAADEKEGRFYLVMEYVSGGDLNTLLKEKGQLPLPQALSISLDVADALTRAHRIDILHRDLKPSNVLLDQYGQPRLTDFGVARLGPSSDLTKAGAALGTVAYLSPEACLGQTLDERADVWSFGVMLYELLTGRRPFEGGTMGAVLNAILNEALPDIGALHPDIPAEISDLLERMLTKDKDHRIPSIRLVGAALEAALSSSDVREILERAERGRPLPGLHDFATPTGTEQPVLHNLPRQSTPFVGREGELAEVTRLLADREVPVTTILGPGGIGKTRLAIEAARRLLPSSTETGDRHIYFPDGEFFISLASTRDAADIPTAVAEGLGFRIKEGLEPREQILAYLAPRSLLLILDNFEHLLSDVELINEIIRRAPDVELCVTSRERLNISGEALMYLEGFDVSELVERPEESSAVQLFLQSAKRVQLDFRVSQENLAEVMTICRLVQGMPLGIVLAAAWVDSISLPQIAVEIQRDIDFLETELRDLPDRQRGMRATFDHSWRLLEQDEKEIFARLSIFRGGFKRHAARTIVQSPLRCLARLVSKSLLQYDAAQDRYSVHELLRQFGAEKLDESGQTEAMRTAHSRYYLEAVAAKEETLKGSEKNKAIQEISSDYENVVAAWRWAVHQAELGLLSRSIAGLNLYYRQSDRRADGNTELGRVLTQIAISPELQAHIQAGKDSSPGEIERHLATSAGSKALEWPHDARETVVLRTKALLFIAYYKSEIAQAVACRDHAQEALLLAQTIGSEELEAHTLSILGLAYDYMSEYDLARKLLLAALPKAKAQDLVDLAAVTLERLVIAEMFSGGSPGQIEQYLQESLFYYRRAGDLFGVSGILSKLGYLAIAQGIGDYSQAKAQFEEGLELSRRLGGSREHELLLLGNLGLMFICEGDYASAEVTLNEAFQLAKNIEQNETAGARLLNYFGYLHANQGDLERAKRVQHSALEQLRVRSLRPWEAKSLTAIGQLHLIKREYKEALSYATQAKELSSAIQDRRQEGYALTAMGRALFHLGRSAEAQEAFEQAAVIHEELEQSNRRLEPLAGLATLFFEQGDRQKAMRMVVEILAHLAANQLDRTNEGFFVLYSIYRILKESEDPRVDTVLKLAYEQLERRAASLKDEGMCEMFWGDLPGHLEIREAAMAGEGAGSSGVEG